MLKEKLKSLGIESENFDIVIVAGGLNAYGDGTGEATFKTNEKIKLLYKPLLFDEDSQRINLGSELIYKDAGLWDSGRNSFYQEFVAMYADNLLKNERKLLVLMTAAGGTGFKSKYWGRDDILFNNTLDLTASLLEINSKNKVIAMLWHQGERDVIDRVMPQRYYTYLNVLVENLRAKLPSFPIIMGDFVPKWKKSSLFAYKISSVIEEFCSDTGFCAFVQTTSLKENSSSEAMSFSAKANKELGKKFYEAFLRIKNFKSVAIFGDSVTEQTNFVSQLNALLYLNNLEENFDVISLGVSSETISGCTEEGHPFKRPKLQTRLSAAIDCVKPDIAFVFYGINDAIYKPFSAERFEAFKKGMIEVVAEITTRGIKPVICTPICFDKFSSAQKTTQLENECHFGAIFDGYDEVMAVYAEWIRKEFRGQFLVIDIYLAVSKFISAMRGMDSEFKSGDGVHPNFEVSTAIAAAMLEGFWSIETDAVKLCVDKKFKKLVRQFYVRDVQIMRYFRKQIGHNTPWELPSLPYFKLRKVSGNINARLQKKKVKSTGQVKKQEIKS